MRVGDCVCARERVCVCGCGCGCGCVCVWVWVCVCGCISTIEAQETYYRGKRDLQTRCEIHGRGVLPGSCFVMTSLSLFVLLFSFSLSRFFFVSFLPLSRSLRAFARALSLATPPPSLSQGRHLENHGTLQHYCTSGCFPHWPAIFFNSRVLHISNDSTSNVTGIFM